MRKILSAIAAVTLAATMAACTSDEEPNGNGSNMALSDDCTPIVVGTSSEKVNLMEELGKEFKNSDAAKGLDNCVTVYPINVPSGKGSEILASTPDEWPDLEEAFYPTMWSPASSTWVERVQAAGGQRYIGDSKSFAQTPVVFGIPESMATALGYPQKDVSIKQIEALINDRQGWGKVGKPLWGLFKIAKTNPNTSTTGMNMILMQSYANAGKVKGLTPADVAKAKEFNRTFESGAIHYGDTTGNVLTTLYNNSNGGGSSYVSAIALEETSLFNYNKGNPDSHTVQPGETLTPPSEKLVAVYPSEGSLWSDNPIVALNAPWVTAEQKAASVAFAEFVQTKAAQEILPKYGFRPVDKSVDASKELTKDLGIDLKRPTKTLEAPTAAVVSAAIDQWAEVRKPSAVLELIDISGSMDESIGGGETRLTAAVKGAQSTLGNLRSNDKIGIWAFTTGVESSVGKNIVSVRDFAPLASDKEKLSSAIGDLNGARKGGTPLWDSVATAYDYMQKNAEPGRINAIVVLSDGEDTDSKTSLDSLLVKVNSKTEGGDDAAVRIFTIAYSSGADKSALARLSEASGGQTFDASNPQQIGEIFAKVMNNF